MQNFFFFKALHTQLPFQNLSLQLPIQINTASNDENEYGGLILSSLVDGDSLWNDGLW